MKIQLSTQGLDFLEVKVIGTDEYYSGRTLVQFWLTETELKHRFVGSDPARSPYDPTISTYTEPL